MKAIGYFAEGRENREEADLLDSFSGYCLRKGHQPVETFVEPDTDDGNRPQFGNMLHFVRESGAEFLVVTAGPHHFGTTLESSVRRMLDLEALGCRVVCDDEDMPDPFQQALRRWRGKGRGGPRGERIKEAMMAKALRGEGLGKPPYGYRIGPQGALEVMPEEAEAVNLIFKLYVRDDMGMRRIVRYLNERETPTRSGGSWSIVTVRDVLRNRACLGTYTRFGMRVPRSHPGIVNPDDFDTAQKKMSRMGTRRAARAEQQPFLLSGVAFCDSCGNRMIGVSRRQGWRRKDGTSSVGSYRYYQCQSRTNQGVCRYRTRRSEALERDVAGQVREALESGRARLRPLDGDAQPSPAEAKGVRRLETQFVRTLERAATGAISLAHVKEALDELDAHRESLKAVSAAGAELADVLAGGDASGLLRRWDSLDAAALGYLVRALVSRVSVGDDSIQVTLTEEE